MKKTMQKFYRRQHFTLVELIVSMALFALLSMMVVQLFSASQKVWVSSNQKTAVSTEGRSALNVIAQMLGNVSAAPEIHAQTSSSDSTDTIYKGGNDYLELDQKGVDGTSRLYFATRSHQPGIKDDTSSVAVCFVGFQVVEIKDSADPDYGRNVLVMSVKTDTGGGAFPDQFPQSDDKIRPALDLNTTTYDDTGTNKINRLATCVVDFKAWICYGKDDIVHKRDNTSNAKREFDTEDDYPCAVEVVLTLMDPVHYELYAKASGSEKSLLLAQHGRTFRRIAWIGNDRRTDDYDEYNQ